MTAAATEADRKRAAQAGRKIVSKHLPPGLARWIDHLATRSASPEEFHAWAGTLASIATALEKAFQHSGAEVRDLILRLHQFLSDPPLSRTSSSAPPPCEELAPFIAWLESRLSDSSAHPPARIVLLQWIDIASERLTLRRYHREDLPAHHAKTLLLAPLRYLGGIVHAPDSRATGNEESREREAELALVFLRFVDVLDAERLGQQGKNRVSPPDAMEFGGFYGISENVQPPSSEELEHWTRDLRERAGTLKQSLNENSPFEPLLTEMETVITARLDRGSWPRDFRSKRTAKHGPKPSFWKRLLGSR